MNKLDLKLTSKVIETKVKPIRTTWTRTMAKDLEIFKSMDLDDLVKSLRPKSRKKKINKIFNKHDREG